MQYEKYAKAIVAIALAAITAITAAYAAITDGAISGEEWKVIGAEALAAFLVWLVPNKPAGNTPPR